MEEPQIVNYPRRRGGWWWLVIILVVVLAGGWWWLKSGGSPLRPQAASSYRAVFLDNDQVYFGKLRNLNRVYATLSDIFYLQVDQPLQPSQPAANVNLIKLGAELHGPADEMLINRDHILFIEELKPDSQVVQAISRYKAEQTQE